jgi:RsiW-degrading membrane proteinase PrsW (M82 family)
MFAKFFLVQRHESALLLGFASQQQRDCVEGNPAVTRNNMLYLVIGALAVAVAVLGYQLYRDRHQPEGVHIELGPGGLSIQGKGK